jgi:hypothetical protein
MTTIISTITALATSAVPAAIMGLTDTASWFAVATIAVGAFIMTWESLKTSEVNKS